MTTHSETYMTGLFKLDYATGGLRPGKVFVFMYCNATAKQMLERTIRSQIRPLQGERKGIFKRVHFLDTAIGNGDVFLAEMRSFYNATTEKGLAGIVFLRVNNHAFYNPEMENYADAILIVQFAKTGIFCASKKNKLGEPVIFFL